MKITWKTATLTAVVSAGLLAIGIARSDENPGVVEAETAVVADFEIEGVRVRLTCPQVRDAIARAEGWKNTAANQASTLEPCDGETANGCPLEWAVYARAHAIQELLKGVLQSACPSA